MCVRGDSRSGVVRQQWWWWWAAAAAAAGLGQLARPGSPWRRPGRDNGNGRREVTDGQLTYRLLTPASTAHYLGRVAEAEGEMEHQREEE